MLDVHAETGSCFHLVFCMQLSRYLGFYPSGRYSNSTPFFDLKEGVFRESAPMHPIYMDASSAAIFDQVLETSLGEVQRLKMPAALRREILRSVITYFELHHTQGYSIRSHEVLAELMN
jgi:DNA repair protein RecO (recombination protein O)